MKVVFLCAGYGKRMGIYKVPKWCMELGREMVLERHLRLWRGHDMYVICGQKDREACSNILHNSRGKCIALDPVFGNAWDTLIRIMPEFSGETLFILGDTVYDESMVPLMEQLSSGSITAFASDTYYNIWSYGKCDETYAVKISDPAGMAEEFRKIQYAGYSLQKLRGWYQLVPFPLSMCRDLDFPIDYYMTLKALGLPWVLKLLVSSLKLHWKIKILLETLYVR